MGHARIPSYLPVDDYFRASYPDSDEQTVGDLELEYIRAVVSGGL